MLKAIKIRLYPNQEQKIYISKLFGCSRFIYNKCLSFKSMEYGLWNNSVKLKDTNKHVIELKSEYEWIKDSHSKVLQQSLINLETAFTNFFKNGAGYPDFKSKHDKQSVRFPIDAISKNSVNGNRINIITQLKDIHFKCSKSDERYLNKNKKQIKSATLNKTKSGDYYFSILVDRTNKVLPEPKNSIIGLDLGIKDFIITSEGQKYENLKSKRNNKTKLARLHRELSRKKKGSKNREEARLKLASFYEKLTNKKEYYMHSIAKQLLSDNQTVVLEDLNVSGMLKNHKLAKSIQEVSWSRFKQILMYKAEWYGRTVILVDRWFPSTKLCSHCGYKNNDLTLNDRTWTCPKCGTTHDRDINSAINIKGEGLRLLRILKLGLSSPDVMPQESKSIDPRRMRKENVKKNNDII